MSIEDNKQLVRRYFEDAPYPPDACDEIFAPSFRFHMIQHTSITSQIVESNPQSEKAAYEWLKTEVWDIYDRLWLWQQLGVLPDIKEGIAQAREAMEKT